MPQRFDLNALSTECHSRAAKARLLHQAQFPIPRLVMGLPWRFVKDTTTPVVPDPDFIPLDLRHIASEEPD
jgi:hypothetical protein